MITVWVLCSLAFAPPERGCLATQYRSEQICLETERAAFARLGIPFPDFLVCRERRTEATS